MYYADIYSLSPFTHSSHTSSIVQTKIYVLLEVFPHLYIIHNAAIWFWFLVCLMHTLTMPDCRKLYDQLVCKKCVRFFYNMGPILISIKILCYIINTENLYYENKKSSDVPIITGGFPIFGKTSLQGNHPLLDNCLVNIQYSSVFFYCCCHVVLMG